MTTQHPEAEEDAARVSADTVGEIIRGQVVRTLGRPDGLLKVTVRTVGNGHYRVNVVVGKDVASSRIADSFFLTADEKGTILASSPKMIRLY